MLDDVTVDVPVVVCDVVVSVIVCVDVSVVDVLLVGVDVGLVTSQP